MLNFFRRIRRNLANQNKFVQYSRYAIGEIILVVIGILIALQINNWNEKKKEKLNEAKILKTLNEEFLENKITLDSTLVLLNKSADALSFVLKNIDEKPKITFKFRL